MSNHTATYSPEDDKLRMTPAGRLPADEYAEIKKAGFQWAPKQGVFYAVWTPDREALMIEWCGEIDDEDTSLIDRAEDRAERFEGYHENRTADAERAHKAVAGICEGIPFGQPILVGHHSEKRARRDAQKIENGMKYAVKMWDTAEYWTRRAAGAIAHAKYKERPDVRARRIKGLESDKRKQQKYLDEAKGMYTAWSFEKLTPEMAVMLSGCSSCYISRCFTLTDYPRELPASQYEGQMGLYSALTGGVIDHLTAADIATQSALRTIEHSQVWIDHINNRLKYECAMLAEGGGLVADKFNFEVGGKVRHKWGWSIIERINKKEGRILSLSLIASSWPFKVNTEDVSDYQPPAEGDSEKVKKATALAPMCNYHAEGFATMTQAEFTAQYKDHKGSDTVKATDTEGRHRIRTISGFIGRRFGGSSKSQWDSIPVFISDAKTKLAPAPEATEPRPELPEVPRELPRVREHVQPAEPTKADELREQLKAGVKVVSAPQLFPTPATLAARMVELAEIEPGMTVLEPSAGTGRIVQAVMNAVDTEIVAFEINHALCSQLTASFPSYVLQARCKDFLQVEDGRGQWERILMNPPFENAVDIKHIKHAYELLKPGGKMVAICAGGPRQAEQLKPLADTWEVLPAGTFEESGTGVSTVLLTMTKPTENPVLSVEPDFCNKPAFSLTYEQARYPDPVMVQESRAVQTDLFSRVAA